MPVAIKDIIEITDMPLREAGAVILGKAVTTEFASTEPRGTHNPWGVERTPGGSSSGSSAAVPQGVVPAALGTQVVGFCGCVGFKTSVGSINRGRGHRQLVASGQLNLRQRRWNQAHCKPTLQISVQISNFWVLAALCSAAVT
jgi:hypothetical protein